MTSGSADLLRAAAKNGSLVFWRLFSGSYIVKSSGADYSQLAAPVCFAPAYDVVTTVAYIPQDIPALSLGGIKKWWTRKTLEKFAIAHLSLPVGTVGQVFERVAGAVEETRKDVKMYMDDHPEFREIGALMLSAWDAGVMLRD